METIIKACLKTIVEYPKSILVVLALVFGFFATWVDDFQLDASSDSLLLEGDQDLRFYKELTLPKLHHLIQPKSKEESKVVCMLSKMVKWFGLHTNPDTINLEVDFVLVAHKYIRIWSIERILENPKALLYRVMINIY